MSPKEKYQAAGAISQGIQTDMEGLNPFEGGITEIEVTLRDSSAARRRRTPSIGSAVADVTVTYSTPPGADLTSIEIPDSTDLANDFTETAKTSLSTVDTLADIVDTTQLDSIVAEVEIDMPETDPGSLVCTGDESFRDAVISCEPDKFALTIHRCVFLSNDLDDKIDDQIYLTPGDDETTCYGVKQLDEVYYDANLDGCSERESNGTHLLHKSTLVYERGMSNSVISRRSSVRVNFVCATPIEIYVSLEHGIASSEINIEESLDHAAMELEVAMGLFQTDSFSSQLDTVPDYGVEEPMYVGISLVNGGDMELRLEKCWATPRYDYSE